MKTLKIADGLSIPIDAVTQTFALIAKRRAGKSYTMRRLAEQLIRAGQQVVLVDPKGDQWGIRSAADGKGPGLSVVILGGERGDVPLEVGAAEVVAKLVVEERVSVVLDLSLFRKREVAVFMADFLEHLYRMKARDQYRTPVMLVVDEADAIAPQKPQPGEERMLGAIEDIVRRGGQRGIGCVLVTQRSAVLNKNVLTQAQILVALRTIAPQDLKAMKDWIDVHGEEEQRKTLMESLPSLPIGDAWFWSPGWPTTEGIFKRVHVLPIETFDSGATPKPGEKRREPKTAADVDLDALKRQMAETVARAEAQDPTKLRAKLVAAEKSLQLKSAEVATLEQRLTRAGAQPKPSKRAEEQAAKNGELRQHLARYRKALEAAMKILVTVKAIDFAVDTAAQREALEAAVLAAVTKVTDQIEKRMTGLEQRVQSIRDAATSAEAAIAELLEQEIDLGVQVQRQEPYKISTIPVAAARARSAAPAAKPAKPAMAIARPDGFVVTAPMQRILNALAWADSARLPPPGKTQLAFLADASPTSSSFQNNLGSLRTAGLIEYPAVGQVGLTDSGRRDARVDGATPTTSFELQASIYEKLSASQRRIVQALVTAHPGAIDKDSLAKLAEASPTSSSFQNNLGMLRSLGLIDYPDRGHVAAQPVLFLE